MTCLLSKTGRTSPSKNETSVNTDWFSYDVKRVCEPDSFELEFTNDNNDLLEHLCAIKFSLSDSGKTKRLFQQFL